MMIALLVVASLACSVRGHHLPSVNLTLPTLGPVTGVEKRTKTYEGAPFSNRPMYTFRGIPYAHPVIDQQRFQQSVIWNDTSFTVDGSPLDATRDGPLCQQGNTTNDMIQDIVNSTVSDLALSVLPPEFALFSDFLIPAILRVLEVTVSCMS